MLYIIIFFAYNKNKKERASMLYSGLTISAKPQNITGKLYFTQLGEPYIEVLMIIFILFVLRYTQTVFNLFFQLTK